MKVTICGSCAFIDEMQQVAEQLKSLGHEVKIPPVFEVTKDGRSLHTRDYYALKKTVPNDPEFWEKHTGRISAHFNKVAWADAILVTNYDKNNIAGYIGPNALMEMGLAFYLGKKIFLLQPVPELAWKEELLGLRPVVVNSQLSLIV
ncbi:MAG: hypothetical protein KGJ93_01370 [Patescibacteria group bacterium]|nr:hypothetical protein [Patescibacteria group bacterium]